MFFIIHILLFTSSTKQSKEPCYRTPYESLKLKETSVLFHAMFIKFINKERTISILTEVTPKTIV